MQIVDDLKVSSMQQDRSDVLQNHVSTPVSMVANNSVRFDEITNRLSSMDDRLVRCLEVFLLHPTYVSSIGICCLLWFDTVTYFGCRENLISMLARQSTQEGSKMKAQTIVWHIG
jgi:hypothetical protein